MAQRAGPVERATRAELRSRKVSVQASGLAAAAVALAKRLDGEHDSKAAAALAGQLRAALGDVAKAVPASPPKDGLDDLRARRVARRRGA